MSWRIASIAPVWVVALVGAITVAVVAGSAALIWLPVVMAVCVLLALGIQLPVGRREGLVNRLTTSIGGALVILVIFTVVLVLAVPGNLPLR